MYKDQKTIINSPWGQNTAQSRGTMPINTLVPDDTVDPDSWGIALVGFRASIDN